MKPLKTFRRCLIWLSAYESSNNRQKLVYTVFTVATLALQIGVFTACSVFCWRFFSTDLGKCIFTFMVANCIFGSIYMTIIAITTMRPRVVEIFKDLSTIYKTSKCPL